MSLLFSFLLSQVVGMRQKLGKADNEKGAMTHRLLSVTDEVAKYLSEIAALNGVRVCCVCVRQRDIG